MEYEISLRDVIFYAGHGLFEEEKKLGNRFKVNLSLFLPFSEEVNRDEISGTISYVDMFNILKEEMELSRNLLETLCASIVKKIKLKYPQIIRGSLSIEKMNPPIAGMIGSAEVTLHF